MLNAEESKDWMEWLVDRGMTLEESARCICDFQSGSPLCTSIIRTFLNRRKEVKNEADNVVDWGNPITPQL